MNLFDNNNYNFCFPKLSGNFLLWLFLISFSANSLAQFHISENTILSVKENTVLHVTDKAHETITAKVEKDVKVKKNIKKSAKPLPPPIKETDTEPENGADVLSFNSGPKTPSALLFAGRSSQLGLVQNISISFKSFPLKKSNNDIVYSFLLKDDEQIITSSNELLLLQQAELEGHITRPPPYQIA